MPASTLKELAEQLLLLSKSDAQIEAIKTFSESLSKTARRIAVFNVPGALLRTPILPEEAQALGFDGPDDRFALLQGDVVSTESAYYLGERVTGSPKYVVLNVFGRIRLINRDRSLTLRSRLCK